MRKFKSFLIGFSVAAVLVATVGTFVALLDFLYNSYGSAGIFSLLAFTFCIWAGFLAMDVPR